jgi:hypothetical protein
LSIFTHREFLYKCSINKQFILYNVLIWMYYSITIWNIQYHFFHHFYMINFSLSRFLSNVQTILQNLLYWWKNILNMILVANPIFFIFEYNFARLLDTSCMYLIKPIGKVRQPVLFLTPFYLSDEVQQDFYF